MAPLRQVLVRQSGLTVRRVGGNCDRPECAGIWYTYFPRYMYHREAILPVSMRCVLSSLVSRRSRYSALMAIGDRTGKPLRVGTLTRAGISIVGRLGTRAGFVDTDTLKRRFLLARRGGSASLMVFMQPFHVIGWSFRSEDHRNDPSSSLVSFVTPTVRVLSGQSSRAITTLSIGYTARRLPSGSARSRSTVILRGRKHGRVGSCGAAVHGLCQGRRR